jgi:hypothetical protein
MGRVAICRTEPCARRFGRESVGVAVVERAAHVGERDDTRLLDLALWATHYSTKSWREVLHGESTDAGLYDGIRHATLSGRPLGSEEFLQGLESDTGRALRPRRGRRPKASPPGFN